MGTRWVARRGAAAASRPTATSCRSGRSRCPGVQPVVCDACGLVVCADPDTPALAAAKFNHSKYCEPIKRRKP